MIRAIAVTATVLLCGAAGAASVPSQPAGAAAAIPHPRMILTPARLSDVQAFIRNDSQATAYYSQLLVQGAWILAAPRVPLPPANATDILIAARSVRLGVRAMHGLTGISMADDARDA